MSHPICSLGVLDPSSPLVNLRLYERSAGTERDHQLLEGELLWELGALERAVCLSDQLVGGRELIESEAPAVSSELEHSAGRELVDPERLSELRLSSALSDHALRRGEFANTAMNQREEPERLLPLREEAVAQRDHLRGLPERELVE